VATPGRGGADVGREQGRRDARIEPHSDVLADGTEGSTGASSGRVDFAGLAETALPYLPQLVARWLPDGRQVGAEWIARNPTRTDRRPGSFRVNLRTGRWADFASGDRGGDVVSLAAYLTGMGQRDAALRLAAALGIRATGGGGHVVAR